MSRSKTLTHDDQERIKAEYMEAYRGVHGDTVADLLIIIYRKGWWYFNQKGAPPGLSTPYRTPQVEQMTLRIRKNYAWRG